MIRETNFIRIPIILVSKHCASELDLAFLICAGVRDVKAL